jgi:hypothetical protein
MPLVMRGLRSCLGGLPLKKSSQMKRPALVVLVIDGSLVLYGRVCSSANPWKVHANLLFGTLVHFLKAVPERRGSQ